MECRELSGMRWDISRVVAVRSPGRADYRVADGWLAWTVCGSRVVLCAIIADRDSIREVPRRAAHQVSENPHGARGPTTSWTLLSHVVRSDRHLVADASVRPAAGDRRKAVRWGGRDSR